MRWVYKAHLIFYIFRMAKRTYVFTVRFRRIFDIDWRFKNILIENCSDVKQALKEMRSKFVLKSTTVIVDNIYSEDAITK